eukprot:TRINITY_DN74470_c0_g1_i1.p1 TRINITY_DN74470_c0_g1~~TRINITY_DN74470_c0_g1_i1.p1  ORF type:complete len:783 (+),score=127.74 TRINITY_DN74470_c0_g1_i1:52-2400(+)
MQRRADDFWMRLSHCSLHLKVNTQLRFRMAPSIDHVDPPLQHRSERRGDGVRLSPGEVTRHEGEALRARRCERLRQVRRREDAFARNARRLSEQARDEWQQQQRAEEVKQELDAQRRRLAELMSERDARETERGAAIRAAAHLREEKKAELVRQQELNARRREVEARRVAEAMEVRREIQNSHVREREKRCERRWLVREVEDQRAQIAAERGRESVSVSGALGREESQHLARALQPRAPVVDDRGQVDYSKTCYHVCRHGGGAIDTQADNFAAVEAEGPCIQAEFNKALSSPSAPTPHQVHVSAERGKAAERERAARQRDAENQRRLAAEAFRERREKALRSASSGAQTGNRWAWRTINSLGVDKAANMEMQKLLSALEPAAPPASRALGEWLPGPSTRGRPNSAGPSMRARSKGRVATSVPTPSEKRAGSRVSTHASDPARPAASSGPGPRLVRSESDTGCSTARNSIQQRSTTNASSGRKHAQGIKDEIRIPLHSTAPIFSKTPQPRSDGAGSADAAGTDSASDWIFATPEQSHSGRHVSAQKTARRPLREVSFDVSSDFTSSGFDESSLSPPGYRGRGFVADTSRAKAIDAFESDRNHSEQAVVSSSLPTHVHSTTMAVSEMTNDRSSHASLAVLPELSHSEATISSAPSDSIRMSRGDPRKNMDALLGEAEALLRETAAAAVPLLGDGANVAGLKEALGTLAGGGANESIDASCNPRALHSHGVSADGRRGEDTQRLHQQAAVLNNRWGAKDLSDQLETICRELDEAVGEVSSSSAVH